MNFGGEFYRFGWGKRWKRPDACEEHSFPLEAPIVFWWTDTESKNEVKAALTTSARREHLFLPILPPSGIQIGFKVFLPMLPGLSPMHGWSVGAGSTS